MQPGPSQRSSAIVATEADPHTVDAAAERQERSRRLAQVAEDAWRSLRATQRTEGARTRPGDALDARVGVVETLRSPRGAAFGARAYHGVPEALDQVPPDTDQTPDEIIAGSAAMVAHLAARLGEANTYWVAPDVVDLVEAAASAMPDQALLTTDLPARVGFAWLPFTVGRTGGWGSFRALAWDLEAAGPDQVRVTTFLDRDDWMRHTRESGPLAASRGFALFPDRWHDWTLGRAWESSFVPDEHVPDVGPIHVRPALHPGPIRGGRPLLAHRPPAGARVAVPPRLPSGRRPGQRRSARPNGPRSAHAPGRQAGRSQERRYGPVGEPLPRRGP